jgi:imidazolonepropionase-like amidohydrolase
MKGPELILTGTVLTGDGITTWEPGYLVVESGRIGEIGPGTPPYAGAIDVGDALITPGLVNLHAHCLTLGPAHATGSRSATEEQVHEYKERHLRGGTTTVMSVDGFPLWSEYVALRQRHPLKVLKCTTHTPANIRAAELADGAGLTDAHRAATVEELVAQGAICVGEVGAGGTLGGGMQENVYIPDAIERLTGRRIEPLQARALKDAVLGRRIDPKALDREALRGALEESGLARVTTEDKVIETIHGTVLPSMEPAYEGLRQAADVAATVDRPFLVHHAAASEEVTLEIAREGMIAGHVNHPTFTVPEALRSARTLRERGALLEISCLNLFTRTKGLSDVDNFLAIVRERLVDFIGTDYASGDYHPTSVALAAIVAKKLVTAAEAVAFCSGNVVRLLPEFTDAGLLETGRPADIAVFAPGLASCRRVYIDGRQVYEASA